MIRCKIAAMEVAVSALAAGPAFPQAAIQDPGAFEFYHPNDDVLNGGAPPVPLKQGDKVPVTLELEKAGNVKLLLDVQGIGAERPSAAFGDMDMKKMPAGMKV